MVHACSIISYQYGLTPTLSLNWSVHYIIFLFFPSLWQCSPCNRRNDNRTAYGWTQLTTDLSYGIVADCPLPSTSETCHDASNPSHPSSFIQQLCTSLPFFKPHGLPRSETLLQLDSNMQGLHLISNSIKTADIVLLSLIVNHVALQVNTFEIRKPRMFHKWLGIEWLPFIWHFFPNTVCLSCVVFKCFIMYYTSMEDVFSSKSVNPMLLLIMKITSVISFTFICHERCLVLPCRCLFPEDIYQKCELSLFNHSLQILGLWLCSHTLRESKVKSRVILILFLE